MLHRLTDTDGWNHLAIGAEVDSEDPEQREGIGVAHLFRLPDSPDVAEVSVAVIDEKQGLGLGRILLLALVEAARARGIGRFRAAMLRDNPRGHALVESLVGAAAVRAEREYLVYDIPLPEPADDLRDGILYHLFKLAASGIQFGFRWLAG